MNAPGVKTWQALSLARQFALTGSAVLLAGMLAIGFWVTRQIEAGVTRNTAIATALYMESFVAPLSQNLASSDTLSPGARRAIDEILTGSAFGERLASFKIWKPGGLVVYSSDPSIVGQRFEPTDNLRAAWTGEVAADFDDLHDAEDAHERSLGLPLLEIYSPIREAWSGRIIAVAEFYEVATELEDNLFRARLTSWLVVAAVTLSMFGLLFGIVLRGSRTIEAQRVAQAARLEELSRLNGQNEALRARVERASRRSAGRRRLSGGEDCHADGLRAGRGRARGAEGRRPGLRAEGGGRRRTAAGGARRGVRLVLRLAGAGRTAAEGGWNAGRRVVPAGRPARRADRSRA